MGSQGPCLHCGINHTPLWRNGPPEKPLLCNACGTRWKARGTLQDYIPKHGIKDGQSSQSQLFPKLNPRSSTTPIFHGFGKPKFFESNVVGHDQPSFVFCSNIGGHDQSPFVFGGEANCVSGSRVTVSANIIKTQTVEAIQAPLWDPNNVSKKKRSNLEQRALSPTVRPHDQLSIIMEEQFDDEDPENLLIFERINKYIPENEIGLGCMLLKPPPSPTDQSKAALPPKK